MVYKTIISIDDLKNNLNNDDFLIFDSRCDIKDSGYGIDSYTEGHIPNSIFVDVDTDLASEKGQEQVVILCRIQKFSENFSLGYEQ